MNATSSLKYYSVNASSMYAQLKDVAETNY